MGSGSGGDGDRRQAQPLLGKLSESEPSYSSSDEHLVKRTGTVWTAMAHIITAVIGSGVLSLAWSVAQLGWAAGPAAMVFFAGVAAVQSSLIADCYISHDPERGGVVRNRSYVDAVRLYLGEKSHLFCGFFIYFGLFGTGVVYTLISATSMRAIQKANCYHWDGHDAPCFAGGDGYYMLVFGLAQAVLSQIPDFHNMAGLSAFAAVMSFFYSSVGFGLGVAKVIANGVIKGGVGGIPVVSTAQKVWRVSQALGDIAFAFPFSSVLLEIEDTLRSPPPESETMKTAAGASIVISTVFYLCCGCLGYAAFGDATPGNLLTGFGFYEPYWLIDLANLCIVLHLLGSYQVYTQPVFGFAVRRRRRQPRERVQAVLSHGIRGGDDGAGRVVPLLQRGDRAARRLHLLAAGHPLPRADVPRQEQGGAVDQAVARHPGVERHLPAGRRLRLRRLSRGGVLVREDLSACLVYKIGWYGTIIFYSSYSIFIGV